MALHTSLMILVFPDKNMFIRMYKFSYDILYVNNSNACISEKILCSDRVGGEGGAGTFGYFFRPLFLPILDILIFSSYILGT